ncbi:hypothetical protein BDM02DRAFT_1315668 [Thelephora ganbajun]|uniref:Uncharacterized protein n=1 Tax=Thelephora ganbajun TaxID=370292 RepID=A0ACB6Z274_THEGA|nr:hypothetical protein BDM02DRAFT_1315668 [Thelephora ganbajun]
MKSRLCILGVVFTVKYIDQPPTPLLWLGHVHIHKSQYREIPRLIVALSTGILELQELYSRPDFELASETQFSLTPPRALKLRFTSATEDARTQTLTVTRRPSSPTPRTIRGLPSGLQECTTRKATPPLTARNLAFPLRSCDRSISSGLTMVVVNYVNREQLFHKYPYETPGGALNKAPKALKDLHASDFEHRHYRSAQYSTRGLRLVRAGRRRGVPDGHQSCRY